MENVRTLSGFMELLPEEQIKFNNIIDIIRNTYEKYGFFPLDTPVLEDTSVLLAKAGGETQKQMYSFKKGDSDISLRFDLTVPLAKYVTLYQNDLTFPFKRYQIGKVYRGEKPQRGRYREFYQCDVDIIGNENLSVANDSEMIAIASEIFEKLNIGKYVIRANNRKILTGLVEALDLTDNIQDVLHALDKLDKIGLDGVRKMLQDVANSEQIEKIEKFISIDGTNLEKIETLKKMSEEFQNPIFDKGIEELEQLLSNVKDYKIEDVFKIDLSIIRGLDYYTGNVFETNLVDHMELGSVCSGGRYENLVSCYSKNKMPGVGISIGLTRLFFLLNEYDLISEENKKYLDYYIIPLDKTNIAYAIEVANVLRNANKKVQINFEDGKVGKKFKLADKLKIQNVIIVGEEEQQNGLVTLKDMKTSEQKQVKLEELV